MASPDGDAANLGRTHRATRMTRVPYRADRASPKTATRTRRSPGLRAPTAGDAERERRRAGSAGAAERDRPTGDLFAHQ